MYLVKKVTETEYEDFLSLPAHIHDRKHLMQKRSDEIALLNGNHTLSKYFSFTAFLCYRERKAVARCAITIYPEKEDAYLGFFDSENDLNAVKSLMETAETYAKEHGKTKITGPVDASFWIGYRMKSNKFHDECFFSEPYGKEYYPKLWQETGYIIAEEYISNMYKKLAKNDLDDPKYQKRFAYFMENDFQIISAKKKDWDTVIGDVYTLLMRRYNSFPVFSHITEDDFRELYKSLRTILDFSMVKLAYKDGKLVGFFIIPPNYQNRLYGKIGLRELFFLLKNRKRCDTYILLYLGVDEKHLGLGSAISNVVFNDLRKRNASSIGALIKKGKFTGKYYDKKILSQREYVLFEKLL